MPQKLNLSSPFAPALIAGAVVLADRLTKLAIQRSFSSYDSTSVIPGLLRIIHTENPGAAFGMLAEGSPLLRTLILVGVSGIVLLFVAWSLWSERSSMTQPLSRLGLSLVLGGAFGNLYDRIVHRSVTDFIEVYHGAWSFPAFNVADSAITVGAILLLLDLWRQDSKASRGRPPVAQEYSSVKRR